MWATVAKSDRNIWQHVLQLRASDPLQIKKRRMHNLHKLNNYWTNMLKGIKGALDGAVMKVEHAC